MSSLKVCVVGIGYVGLPLAYLLTQYSGADICAYDTNHERIAAASKGWDHTNMIPPRVVEIHHGEIEWHTSLPHGADIYIVCVPTPDNNGTPDYEYVDDACAAILSVIKPGGCLILESTVGPGTLRNRVEPMLAQFDLTVDDILLVCSPERIDPGPRAYYDMRQAMKLIGVDNADHQALDKVLLVYSRTFNGIELINDTRATELAKCFENFQRDMNIAMMNELSMQCHLQGVSLSSVMASLRTKPSSPSFHSGMVGGHCIPVDSHYLAEWYDSSRSGTDLPSKARSMNERYIRYVYDLIRRAPTKDTKHVLILGETYKPNVEDTRNSGAKKLQHMLAHEGILCDMYDPLLGETPTMFSGAYNVLVPAVYHRQFYEIVTFLQTFRLAIDCTAINVGRFPQSMFAGISNVINL